MACYNSGWGCYSNNHYLCDTLIYNIIVLGGVACYNSGWGYYSNNHYLCDTLIYNIIVLGGVACYQYFPVKNCTAIDIINIL